MKIVSAFFANSVESRAGLLSVLGAFPEWWELKDLPSEWNIAMAVVAQVEPDEFGQEFVLAVTMEHADKVQGVGEVRFTRGQSDRLVAGAPAYVLMHVPVRVVFTEVGPWRFNILHRGDKVWEIPVGVWFGGSTGPTWEHDTLPTVEPGDGAGLH